MFVEFKELPSAFTGKPLNFDSGALEFRSQPQPNQRHQHQQRHQHSQRKQQTGQRLARTAESRSEPHDVIKALLSADRAIKIFAPSIECPFLMSKTVCKLLHHFACKQTNNEIQILLNDCTLQELRRSPITRLAKKHISKISVRKAAAKEDYLKSMYIIIDYRMVLQLDDFTKPSEAKLINNDTRNRMVRESFDPKWHSSRYIQELKAL